MPILRRHAWRAAAGFATAAAIVGTHFILFPDSGRRIPIFLVAVAAAAAPFADLRSSRRQSKYKEGRHVSTKQDWKPWGRARGEDVVHPWSRWNRDDMG